MNRLAPIQRCGKLRIVTLGIRSTGPFRTLSLSLSLSLSPTPSRAYLQRGAAPVRRHRLRQLPQRVVREPQPQPHRRAAARRRRRRLQWARAA